VPLFYDVVYLTKMAIEATGVTGDPAKLAEERLRLRDYMRNLKDFPGVQFDFSIASGIARTPSFLFRIEEGQKRPPGDLPASVRLNSARDDPSWSSLALSQCRQGWWTKDRPGWFREPGRA